MENHIGEVYKGIISTVTNYGMYVELPNLVVGLVKIEDINDDFLKYVCDAYRRNYNDDNDPFLNPEKVNLDILKFLPKIRFFE